MRILGCIRCLCETAWRDWQRISSTACLAKSDARRAGCGRKPPVIRGRGDSKRLWAADALRDVVRDYVLETLADDGAVLVIDETGFLKQGKAVDFRPELTWLFH
jgi:hypothetical protein